MCILKKMQNEFIDELCNFAKEIKFIGIYAYDNF